MTDPTPCDHKFVDSKRCLKCGWEPPPAPPGKVLAKVLREREKVYAEAVDQFRYHLDELTAYPL